MAQSIEVLVPYRDLTSGQDQEAVLMVFFVEDDNPIVTTEISELEQHDLSVKFIHAAEVFSTLDPKNLTEAGAASFFFTTIHKDSTLKADNYKPGEKHWKLKRETGEIIRFRPKLKLFLKLRSPLLWAQRDLEHKQEDEVKVKIRFTFDDVETLGLPQGNKNKCIFFDGSDSSDKLDGMRKEDDEGFDLKDLINLPRATRDWKDDDHLWAPKLLLFDSFNLGPAPLGRHYYTMGFVNLSEPEKREKYGLEFGYNCVRHDQYKGWGTDDESASRLWPLSLAPLGNYQAKNNVPEPAQRKYDIVATQKSADIDQVDWQFKFYSYSDESLFQSFTPLGFWNDQITERYGQALSTARGHDPGSIIPRFQSDSLTGKFEWTINYDVIDKAPHWPFEEEGGAHDPSEWLQPEQFAFSLKKDEALSLVKDSEVATVQLSNFQTKDGTPLVRKLRFKNIQFQQFGTDQIDPDDDGPGFSVAVHDLANAVLPADAPQSRVGALDLHFLPPGEQAVEGQFEQSQITTIFQGLGSFQKGNAGPDGHNSPRFKTWQPAIYANLILQLGAFGPGDQDPLPTEGTRAETRRVSSIIVPIDREKSLLKDPFLLVATELATRSVNHSLRLRLERGGVGPAGSEQADGFDLVVLDTEPFLISRVIASMDLAQAFEIGNWTGDSPGGASWELKDLGGGFKLIVPPQATGEEFIRKYDEPGQSTTKPLDYRFSPPGTFKLSRTPFKQSFSEAPWNLRRLLGYPGQRQPGMGVYSLNFELLYGLTTTISTDPSDLNLTELNALIGNPPSPLDPTPNLYIEGAKIDPSTDYLRLAYQDYRAGVATNLRQIKTRLGLLQPRLPNQKSPFVTLRDGVSYRFRCSRQVASPFDQAGEPIAGCESGHRYPANGLRGGVDWGFTSRNIYTEVLQSGPSSSGLITNPSFTALGGNGFQKASFARDKSSIYSDTYLGRTFFYSLERIGRIGMLWNTAKHVIIFERSVVHTQQFPDEQHDWLGRPVVRKVREFVEILQPERSYPEFGEAPVVRGFARGSKFPHPVINVDSAWGRDIPGGWIVPLHNPSANQDVYPVPQVLLKLTTSDKQSTLPLEVKKAEPAVKEEGPFVWGTVTNPEDLVFYTSTNPRDDANTDGWNPAPGVDYPLAEVPTNDKEIFPESTPVNSASQGYERFTLRLNTGGTPVNLLAERLNDITDAVVENVTLVRRNLEKVPASVANDVQPKIDAALTQGKQIEAKLKQDIDAVLSTLRRPGTKLKDITDQIVALGKRAEADIAELKTKYEAIARNRVISLIAQAHASLKNAWVNRFNQLAGGLHDDFAEVIARTTAGTEARKKEIDELLKLYHRHVDNANTLLDQFKESTRRAQSLFDNLSIAFKKETGAVRESINKALDLVKAGAGYSAEKIPVYRQQILAILSNVESSLTTARNQLAALDHKFLEAVEAAYLQLVGELLPLQAKFPLSEADIEEINKWLDDLKERFDALRDKLNLETSEAFKEIQSKLAALQQERETLNAHISVAIADLLYRLSTFDKQALDPLENQLRAGVDRIFESAEGYSAELRQEIELGLGQFNTISEGVRQRIARARAIAEQIVKGLDGLDELGPEVKDKIQRALNDVTQNVLGPVRDAVAPYEQWVKEAEKLNVPSLAIPDAQKLADRTLRLLRAHGLAPIGEAINLNRDRIAYYFNERVKGAEGVIRQLENSVDITHAKALVDSARDSVKKNIKSLGIELPSTRIAEKFLPDIERLKNLNLNDILPNFAGINLTDLFSDVRFPLTQSETVRITHGIDPSTYRPWAQCDVDLTMPQDADVLNIGAVIITIEQGAKFTAHTRIAVDQSGGLKREVKAAIFADWRLTVGGQRVMTIKKSTLHFDDSGKIRFDMEARNVELAEVMKFISDLLAKVNMSNKSGLSFELLKDGMVPVGARASLNLALPVLQFGAFSISNLALTALFEVAFRGGKFYLATGLGLATKERPFNLSIMCLGGGGWFTVKALYVPADRQIMALLSIGMSAGASLPFDIGVASGGIYFFVGLGVEYLYSGGRGSLTLLLRISITGELNILGIISVSVLIALEARYGQGSLVCSGILKVSIKICWCFTLSVSAGFSLTLAGSGGGSAADLLNAAPQNPHETIENAVTNYIASFGE